jgi:3,4-dihydroxy 2-butanone 4-phosphate synthase/GTP cyclohydrolase II
MTNNPAKSDFLNQAGIKVNSYVSIIVGGAAQNVQYLETKRARMGHIIPEVKA